MDAALVGAVRVLGVCLSVTAVVVCVLIGAVAGVSAHIFPRIHLSFIIRVHRI